jgi:hypothetical protein
MASDVYVLSRVRSLAPRTLICVFATLCVCALAHTGSNQPFYCLEDYKPIGALLREVPVHDAAGAARHHHSTAPPLTGGQVARLCAAACEDSQACGGFRAVGPEAATSNISSSSGSSNSTGASCVLLANVTAALPSELQLADGHPWPHVSANISR